MTADGARHQKSDGILREGERVRFLFIRTEKANYPLTVLCRVLKVYRSGYYAFEKRDPLARETSDQELTVQIQEVHQKSRQTYGSPRVHQELCMSRHPQLGRNRVARFAFCRHCRSATTPVLPYGRSQTRTAGGSESTQPPVRNDPAEPGWVGDATYIRTEVGWLYLAVILDLFSRRVVGDALSRRNDTQLALAALKAAIKCRNFPFGLLHETD